jgi:RecJ-like exonuclease
VKEKTLLKIALAVGIIGIAVLFVMSNRIKVDEAMLGRLDEMVDESVVVTGSVVGVNSLDAVTFVMIQKDEIVSVALFGKVPVIEVGDLVQVRGKVTEHEGETEIIGEEVRVV